MDFNIWQLLAGVGVLLYGISIFEQAISFLGGKKLKHLLQKYTSTTWSSIFTGAATTTMMQSSSLVSLLVLAFAGAGVMQLQNAIGVIFGANIGSPMLPLFTALIGFGDFKISMLAFPLIAVGGLAMIFVKDEKLTWIARLFVGFGLLFIGLERMQESVATFQESFDLSAYKEMSLWGFGLLGIIATVAIQSAGALNIISLTALSAGIITFPASIAIALGSNLGTTITAIIGSLGGKRIKRQVALSHVLFNVCAAIIGITFFWQYIWVVNNLFGLEESPVLGSAVWNVLYNASTCILFGFFLIQFTKVVKRLMPDKKEETILLHVDAISGQYNDPSFVSPTLLALHEDCKTVINLAHQYVLYIYGLSPKIIAAPNFSPHTLPEKLIRWNKEEHIRLYDDTKKIADRLLMVATHMKEFKLPKNSAAHLHNIETCIYGSLKAIKSIKNIRRDLLDIRTHDDPIYQEMYQTIILKQLQISRYLLLMDDTKEDNYEAVTMAFSIVKKQHKKLLKYISSLATENRLGDINLATLINIDHYVFESNEMVTVGYANIFLNHHEAHAFEKTQDIDEEIYESFRTTTK